MTPVLVIRPQPGCDATVAAAREMGLEAEGFPLFEVRPLPWEAPDPEEVDAVLLGSANALRHGGAALAVLFGKPAYAVGDTTAEAARLAGFDVVETGQGSMQDLLGRLHPDHTRLLRPAGQQRVELSPPEGVVIDERAVYASEPVDMPGGLAAKLAEPAIVALHSGEAARHFAACCDSNGIDRTQIALVAISQRAAEMAGDGWREVKIALNPDDRALLAMAKQMCKEPGNDKDNQAGSMQDQTTSEVFVPAYAPKKRRFGGRLLIVLLAFVLAAAVIGWFAWNGYFGTAASEDPEPTLEATLESEPAAPASAGAAVDPPNAEEQLKAVTTVEGRLAMLEDRLSRLDLQADAASGNVGRAEGLLIAFATRRMIDRGEPLRYLSDQLRLRFANAQPRAVDTIIEFSQAPVTMDELAARLEALAPQLTEGESEEGFWKSFTRELGQLFVIRRDSSSVMTPQARIERARVMLTARRIPEAIEQVELLPGAAAADKWVVDARRFAEVQAALDLIETAAMLEPRKLKDSEGRRIDQPSPIATPVEAKPAEMKQD